MTEKNIEQALKESPDPDWQGRRHSLEEFRQFIRGKANVEKRYADLKTD